MSLFKMTGEVLSGIRLSSSSSKQVMLGVHMLAMGSWDLSVVFKVCAPSVVTHECLTELCLEFRMLFVVFVLSPFLAMATSLEDRLIREKLLI